MRGEHARGGRRGAVPWWMIFLLTGAAMFAACGLGAAYLHVTTGWTP